MRQLRLDFSDDTDKVLVDKSRGTTKQDFLNAIRCLTTIYFAYDCIDGASEEETVSTLSQVAQEAYKRFVNVDINAAPDPSEWGVQIDE